MTIGTEIRVNTQWFCVQKTHIHQIWIISTGIRWRPGSETKTPGSETKTPDSETKTPDSETKNPDSETKNIRKLKTPGSETKP